MQELSLYQITNAFPELMEAEDITEENKKEIENELIELLKNKSRNIIGYTKNIELTIDAMKEEEKRIADNRKILENKLKTFKTYIKDCMENNNIKKVETELGTLSIAQSPISVEIINEDKIPNEYKTEVVTINIDKKKIAEEFKATGELIEGVAIHADNTNLRIK